MFFPLFGFLLLLTSSCLASRKNVLLIIADDLRPNLNSYLPTPSFSSPEIHTPNLDELAATSAVFNRAYVQYALCGPSRNSFLTGRRPDTTRCYAEHQFRARGLDVAVSLPQYFKENGYMTLGMGKVFHPGMPNTPKGDDYPKSWNEKIFHTNSTDDPSNSWKAYTEEEMEETTLRDIANTDYTIEKLRELAPAALIGEKNFFIAYGLHKPHQPWDCPAEFYDLYPEEVVGLPANPYVPEDFPDVAWARPTGVLNFPDCSPEGQGIPDLGLPNVTFHDSKTLEIRRAYYACVSFADQQIGRVLREVEELGLAENTVVMFVGDHGLQLGEHAEWDKQTNFEIAHRAPFMLRVPGVAPKVTDKMVEFVDIMPTLVEAAGFPPVDKCPEYSRNVSWCREGASVMPILGGWGEGKDAVFYQQGRGYYLMNHPEKFVQGYSVMTTQYRYTEYVGLTDAETEEQQPNWGDVHDWGELYDLEADPQENFNLYRDHDYLDLKVQMRKLLHAGWYDHN